MHSADYAVAHAGIVSKQLYKSSFFSPSGSPIVLAFPHQTEWQYSGGDSPNKGVKCKRVWKNHDFRQISRFISQMMQDRAIVTMEGE